jgi:hypothetical protein
MRLSKGFKSMIYTLCRSLIIILICLLILYYFLHAIGYRGPVCLGRWPSYNCYAIEGFNATQWAGPPYISGAAFKALCKYNLDDRYELIPYDETIEEGDRVFLKIIDIPEFLATPPPVKVTLVISNSDEGFTDSLYEQLQPYVTSVCAINCSASNAHQIPIGFRDDMYTPHSDLADILNDSQKSAEKNILCLLNFLIATNPKERQEVHDAFLNKPWAVIDHEYKNTNSIKSLNFQDPETIQKRLDCYAKLKQAKFVVCPPGVGRDTHRVYETLFFGGIPIIKTSFLDPMYEKLGGCWIVNDWSEVTEESCRQRWALKAESSLAVDPSAWLNGTIE